MELGAKKARELAKKGHQVEPVRIEGRTIARTFWGQSWCENLERYSDFENRLPRGRTYVRNGSVVHLGIERGRVKALVSGYEVYNVSISFSPLAKKRWSAIKAACAGKIESVIELLEGKFSRGVMEVMTARDTGLFPAPKEIEMECSCPDWAVMCKHVAAVLYGVGARLDARPDLLFELRGVDQAELVKRAVAGAARLGGDAGEAMDAGKMEQVFGIEIDAAANPSADPGGSVPPAPARAARASAPAAPDRARRAAGRLKARRTRPPARNGDGRGGRPVNDRAARPAGNSAARVAENGAVASGKGSAPAAQNVALETRLPDLQRFFGEADFLTNSDYRRLFSVKVLAASRELAGLTARGVLIRSGYTRGTQYRAGPALGP